jgi:hypothetical protein
MMRRRPGIDVLVTALSAAHSRHVTPPSNNTTVRPETRGKSVVADSERELIASAGVAVGSGVGVGDGSGMADGWGEDNASGEADTSGVAIRSGGG